MPQKSAYTTHLSNFRQFVFPCDPAHFAAVEGDKNCPKWGDTVYYIQEKKKRGLKEQHKGGPLRRSEFGV